MGLDRSPEKIASGESSKPVCSISKAEIETAAESSRTTCNHEVHRRCIESHFQKSRLCPVCKYQCGPSGSKAPDARETRSRSSMQQSEPTKSFDLPGANFGRACVLAPTRSGDRRSTGGREVGRLSQTAGEILLFFVK